MASKYQDRRKWMLTGAQAKLRNLALEEQTVARTNAIYRRAAKDIEKEVSEIYLKLGALSEANRWEFKGLRHPATRKDINKLAAAVDKAGLTEYLPEKIQNRMTYLQVKQGNIWLKLNEAGATSQRLTKDGIMRTMQTSSSLWKKAAGAGAESFIGFDRNVCGYMMGMNWADGNFSSRLWHTTQATWEQVREELAVALANGQPIEKTKQRLRELLIRGHNPKAQGSGGINYDVERIIRTEYAKASTQADIVRWREMGVTKVQWHASFEKNTCEHCAALDGKVYNLNTAEQPPLHPNCRCYLTAYDEVAAEYPDTTYYKNEQGEYEEIMWAPYRDVIDEDGQLKDSAVRARDYFWNQSPWTVYAPPKTKLEFEGDLNAEVEDIVSRTYQGIADQYPELTERMDGWYDNTVTLHKGNEVMVENQVERIGGMVDKANHKIVITYPDKKKGGNVLSQMAEQAKEQFAKGNWSTDKDNHSIMHELAHMLSEQLKSRGVKVEDIIKEATGTKSMAAARAVLRKKVSKQAAKNANEAFAELGAKTWAQDPTLLDAITGRFSNSVTKALALPKRTTKIKVK